MSETALIVQPGEETRRQNKSNSVFWSRIPFSQTPTSTDMAQLCGLEET
jgi:hypothetical protein